jgi:PTH1 family peptidyl-tRNA hydrolase
MKLIVGLGNPGKKFEKTRHNLGFLVVESLKSKIKSFSDWKKSKKFLSEISEGKINSERVILVKPQTFMNNSGKAVKSLIRNFLLNKAMAELSRHLFIIHDDIDIPIGKFKISIGRGPAGHKGVQSIIDEIGTKNFVRFRIGIKPQNKIRMGAFAYPSGARRAERGCAIRMQKFVLEEFNEKEEKILKEVIEMACRAIEMAIKEGIKKAMSEFNK